MVGIGIRVRIGSRIAWDQGLVMGLGLPPSFWETLLAVVVVPVGITTFDILVLETGSKLLLLT